MLVLPRMYVLFRTLAQADQIPSVAIDSIRLVIQIPKYSRAVPVKVTATAPSGAFTVTLPVHRRLAIHCQHRNAKGTVDRHGFSSLQGAGVLGSKGQVLAMTHCQHFGRRAVQV